MSRKPLMYVFVPERGENDPPILKVVYGAGEAIIYNCPAVELARHYAHTKGYAYEQPKLIQEGAPPTIFFTPFPMEDF